MPKTKPRKCAICGRVYDGTMNFGFDSEIGYICEACIFKPAEEVEDEVDDE